MGQLEGKVAFVTGGLSGIGRAAAELFAREGASVVVFDLLDRSRDDDARSAHELVAGFAGEGLWVRGDVTSAREVELGFDRALDRFGRVDVLANFAGISMFKPIEELTIDDFDRVIAINVRGTFLTCKRAIAEMRRRGGGGAIVNVASNFAFVAEPEASAYCASKGAVATMTKGLALEAGPNGIRVNALCPGATATALNREHRRREEVVRAWRRKTPLQIADREESDFLAHPEDIARAALFLASDASIYMTGASLVVDGGWNAE